MDHAGRLREAVRAASAGLVGRQLVVELVVLAAVARAHLLVIGPPGTAKSEAVRRVGAALGGRRFEYLLGRFTEPSEIFGPIDLAKLRDGVLETRTDGMLPEAEFAFLDEIFLGSTAILNTLLGVLNERVYRRGHTVVQVPLRVCVGASNGLPDDPALAAFADRFLLRVYLEDVEDPLLEDLLAGGWSGSAVRGAVASVEDLDAVAARAAGMDPATVRDPLAAAIRTLRSAGLALSDRRVVATQRLITAAAALDGRDQPTGADLWPLVYAVPDAEGQALAREVLRNQLDAAKSEALAAAAEAASASPAARAARLTEALDGLLASEARDLGWQLKVEGALREVDAGFATAALPPALRSARDRAVSAIEAR